MGKVVSVNISEKKGTVKVAIGKGEFLENHGLVDDAHAGVGHRQVSLLGIESIKKVEDSSDKKIGVGKFAENLTTEGISLYTLAIGTKVRIGDTIQEITQIGKECHKGCEIQQQIGECIMPREGVFTKVIKSGVIENGDEIEIIG